MQQGKKNTVSFSILIYVLIDIWTVKYSKEKPCIPYFRVFETILFIWTYWHYYFSDFQ